MMELTIKAKAVKECVAKHYKSHGSAVVFVDKAWEGKKVLAILVEEDANGNH